jgi:hypothetical protein
MTLEEAINEVHKRSGNINLQWFIEKWNDGFIIHSTSHMKRYPDTKYVYTTGDGNINKSWYVEFDKEEKRFKHKVHNGKRTSN